MSKTKHLQCIPPDIAQKWHHLPSAALFIRTRKISIIPRTLTCLLTLEELSLRLPEAANLRGRCLRRAPWPPGGASSVPAPATLCKNANILEPDLTHWFVDLHATWFPVSFTKTTTVRLHFYWAWRIEVSQTKPAGKRMWQRNENICTK